VTTIKQTGAKKRRDDGSDAKIYAQGSATINSDRSMGSANSSNARRNGASIYGNDIHLRSGKVVPSRIEYRDPSTDNEEREFSGFMDSV
jgi:hypothetical protein